MRKRISKFVYEPEGEQEINKSDILLGSNKTVPVAQPDLEHEISNLTVAGSSPAGHAI